MFHAVWSWCNCGKHAILCVTQTIYTVTKCYKNMLQMHTAKNMLQMHVTIVRWNCLLPLYDADVKVNCIMTYCSGRPWITPMWFHSYTFLIFYSIYSKDTPVVIRLVLCDSSCSFCIKCTPIWHCIPWKTTLMAAEIVEGGIATQWQ